MADLSKMQVGTTVYNMKDVTARNSLTPATQAKMGLMSAEDKRTLDEMKDLYIQIESSSYVSLIDGLKDNADEVMYLLRNAYKLKSVGLINVQNVDGGYFTGVLVPEFTTSYPDAEEHELYQGSVYLSQPKGVVFCYQIAFNSDSSLKYRELKCTVGNWTGIQ